MSVREPRPHPKSTFRIFKKQSIVAAVELKYPADIVDRIRKAGTEGEILRALAAGRERTE